MKRAAVKLGRARISCIVAQTPREQARGLQGHPPLRDGEGMIFPFMPPKRASFHMGTVDFPIDIVFFDSSLRASRIVTAAPGSRESWSADDCLAVVELPAGWCRKAGFQVGGQAELSYGAPAPVQREPLDDPTEVPPEEQYVDRQDVSLSSPDAMDGANPYWKEQYGYSALEESDYPVRPGVVAQRAAKRHPHDFPHHYRFTVEGPLPEDADFGRQTFTGKRPAEQWEMFRDELRRRLTEVEPDVFQSGRYDTDFSLELRDFDVQPMPSGGNQIKVEGVVRVDNESDAKGVIIQYVVYGFMSFSHSQGQVQMGSPLNRQDMKITELSKVTKYAQADMPPNVDDPGLFAASLLEAATRTGGIQWRPEVITGGSVESAVIDRDDIKRWLGTIEIAGRQTVEATAGSPAGLRALGDAMVLSGMAKLTRTIGDKLAVWRW
jgi:uncharacterized membrane protein (UPF0127 family)